MGVLALTIYLVPLFLYWASVPGWTNNNALPAQSRYYAACKHSETLNEILK
jgi:hypothetical protein